MTLPPISAVVRDLAAWPLREPSAQIDAAAMRDENAVRRLVDEARLHRVTGVAISALDTGALGEPLPRLREALVEEQHRLLRQTLVAESDLVRVVRCLDRAGIETRVLKGLATAHLDHDDPSQRLTSDVDVLVRPNELAAATSALTSLVDHTATPPDRRRSHTDRYGKDRTLKLVDGGWLDLHRNIVTAYWGLSLDHDRFFAAADTFEVAGTPMHGLGAEDRLLHALLHAGATDQIRLHSFRDVIVMFGKAEIAAAAEAFTTRRELRPVHGLLAAGVLRTHALFDVDLPLLAWARSVRPTRRERIALRIHELDGARDHWTGPLALAPHRWPGYLGPIVMPSAEYRRWYGRTRGEHLATARRALRRRQSKTMPD